MPESSGLMESLKRMVCTMLTILQTRLELLSNEIEEERLHIQKMLLYGSVALFFFGLSILILTIFIVVLFWESNRLLLLGSFAVIYFFAGLVAWNALCRLRDEKSKLFSVSLAELTEDRDLLTPRQ